MNAKEAKKREWRWHDGKATERKKIPRKSEKIASKCNHRKKQVNNLSADVIFPDL